MICRKCLLHILERVLYGFTPLQSCSASKLHGEATLLRVLVMFDKKGVARSRNKVLYGGKTMIPLVNGWGFSYLT
jgi:hypothetical protein